MKKLMVPMAALSLLAVGCKQEQPKVSDNFITNAADYKQVEMEAQTQPAPEFVRSETVQEVKAAQATIAGTKDNKVTGTVTFTVVEDGVKIVADLDGLTPGKHGFHIHEKGDCGHDGDNAGGHFNPTAKKHGGPDSEERHVGDLGNVEADSSGHAHYERTDKLIALSGPNSIIGRSVVVHEKEDDLKTDPSGNSGSRIGCGAIVAQ